MTNRQIKTIIVDDEKPSREALATYIRDFCPDIMIAAECESARTAHQAILEHQPQLVFLDIEMPNGSGFDLLQKFKNPGFRVIFVTAFSEYAIKAFRFAAVDYLLKPVKVDELREAVERVKADLDKEFRHESLKVLIDTLEKRDGEQSQLVVRDTKGFTVVRIDELIMCEADGYCTILHLTGKRKVTSSRNIGYYEELFDQRQMLKVHRSYLVNPQKVTGYSRQGEIHLDESLTCPLGDRYRAQFLERYKG